MAVAVGIFLLGAVSLAHTKPLWHDELFTYYIAKAPNLQGMKREIQTMDFNPPLIYLCVRWTDRLLGVSGLSARLPSIAGFTLALVCSFVWIRRHAGGTWAVVAVLALVANSHGFATEARPYGLLFGFVCLAVLGLDLAERYVPRGGAAAPQATARRAGLAMLFVGLTAAMLSHMLALPIVLLVLGAVLAVGLVWGQDWPLLAASALPLAAFLVSRPMMSAHSASLFPPSFIPTLSSIATFYSDSLLRLGTLFGLVIVAALLLLGPRAFGGEGRWDATPTVTIVLLGMLLAPAALILYSIHTHAAFFPRYGFMGDIALALLLPMGTAWMTQSRKPVALLALAIMAAGNVREAQYAAAGLRPSTWRMPVDGPTDFPAEMSAVGGELPSKLPIVVTSGLGFVEMNHRESQEFLRRTHFLLDPEAAATYAHATIFNGMEEEKRSFGFSGNVDGYTTFVAAHPCFLAFGSYSYPEDWVLRKLEADGATLTLRKELTETEYYGTDVWQVQMPGAPAERCSGNGEDPGK